MPSTRDTCPHCGASLIGNPIPTAVRHLFGGATHFRREIGISDRDRVVEWVCPDCGGRWPRETTPCR